MSMTVDKSAMPDDDALPVMGDSIKKTFNRKKDKWESETIKAKSPSKGLKKAGKVASRTLNSGSNKHSSEVQGNFPIHKMSLNMQPRLDSAFKSMPTRGAGSIRSL